MPVLAPSSSPYVLAAAPVVAEPFAHFIAAPAVDEATCCALLAWLRDGVPWRFHETVFYMQLECNLANAAAPEGCRALFEPAHLDGLRDAVARCFQVSLAPRLTVVGHKLLPGYRIGLHNDNPAPGMETHRLVLQLSAPGLKGGDLLFHGSRHDDDVRVRIGPGYNTAVGFALSSMSYHSVTPVEEGIRYTVIFSFWSEQAAVPEERLQFVGTPFCEALIRLLRALGAHTVAHTGRDLLEHLLGTSRLLDAWRCAPALCVAGLFHSVYGTETLLDRVVPLSDREAFASILGVRAERLVYLYCHASKRAVYDALGSGASEVVAVLGGRAECLTRQELLDLLVLDAANLVEQALEAHVVDDETSPDSAMVGQLRILAPLLPRMAQHRLTELGYL